MTNTLDLEVLRRILRYDPDTGNLYWLPRTPDLFGPSGRGGALGVCARWNSRHSGKRALCSATKEGYLAGEIFARNFLAHRVVWALQNGRWPAHEIDHINGCRSDNRISNLREAIRAQNQHNKRLSRANTSGVKGVNFDRHRGKWRARILAYGVTTNLGRFNRLEDAAAAISAARATMHGEFANQGEVK